jgi:hypothetical protein
VVVGDRQTHLVEHFSPSKKLLQRFGSWVVRAFSNVDVPDAVSGFRAISRDAAFRLNIVSPFSYTIEMLIQVGFKGMSFTSVPIRTNAKTRESRLFKSIFTFIEKSAVTLVRMYSMYQPLRVFTIGGLALTILGTIPMVRFLYFYFFETGTGKIQSLIIGSALLTSGVICLALGLMADLLGQNRQLIEITLEKVRRIEDRLDEEPAPRAGGSVHKIGRPLRSAPPPRPVQQAQGPANRDKDQERGDKVAIPQ